MIVRKKEGEREMCRQIDRQTNRQTERQTARQRERAVDGNRFIKTNGEFQFIDRRGGEDLQLG